MFKQRPNLDLATALRMTRPGFVIITVGACLLGFSLAHWHGAVLRGSLALVVTMTAVVMHAAANVLNDYHDACNGADAANAQGVFPFTGGARLIQNGEVTPEQTRGLAYALALAVLPVGAWMAWHFGAPVIYIGSAGALLGWAYSAPPLRLMTRGAGEITVGCVWALIVLGSAIVFDPTADVVALLWPALGYGALIANILLINAYPDAPADASVAKRTAVVRLGPQRAAWVYGALWLTSLGAVLGGMAVEALPLTALSVLLSVPTGVAACVGLWRNALAPQRLRFAIVCTIATAVIYAATLSAACWYSAVLAGL